MIKPRKNKLVSAIIVAFEVLLIAGAFCLDYFTRKKMGMARYVSHLNYTLEDQLPVHLLIRIVMIILGILTVCILIMFLRKRKRWKFKTVAGIMVMTVLTVLFIGFGLINSRETQRSYYLVSVCYGLAAFLQIVWTGMILFRGNNET